MSSEWLRPQDEAVPKPNREHPCGIYPIPSPFITIPLPIDSLDSRSSGDINVLFSSNRSSRGGGPHISIDHIADAQATVFAF